MVEASWGSLLHRNASLRCRPALAPSPLSRLCGHDARWNRSEPHLDPKALHVVIVGTTRIRIRCHERGKPAWFVRDADARDIRLILLYAACVLGNRRGRIVVVVGHACAATAGFNSNSDNV